jgi:hypothetical protein
MLSTPNVSKHASIRHGNDPWEKVPGGPFPLVAATLVAARVQLRGFEPLPLPAEMPLDLHVRSDSFRFSPVRYLRFCFRVLTASRLFGGAALQIGEVSISVSRP